MLLRFAILGLLAEQPRHGYAILAALEERFAELLDPSAGDVYRALSTLERADWVAPARARVGRRPERKVYSPTPAGRDALDAWLSGADAGRRRADDDALWLRVLVAERCAPQIVERLVERRAARERAALAEHEPSLPRTRDAASFTSLVLALRRASELRVARARLDGLDACLRIVARWQRGTTVDALLREVVESSRAGARSPTG
jgi:DNA-binding PadR family transcriptional regulator